MRARMLSGCREEDISICANHRRFVPEKKRENKRFSTTVGQELKTEQNIAPSM